MAERSRTRRRRLVSPRRDVAPVVRAGEIVRITDKRIKLDLALGAHIRTIDMIARFQPVINVPFIWDPDLQHLKLAERGEEVTSFDKGKFWLAEPSPLVVTQHEYLRILANRALLTQYRPEHAHTTTPLGAAGSWTSTFEEVLNYSRITGTVYADQAGTLYVEQSPDGVNVDETSTIVLGAGDRIGFTVELIAQYVRLRYVNGGVAQGAFRCYGWLRVI